MNLAKLAGRPVTLGQKASFQCASLFSLVALEVAYRRREFAIRLALGSAPRAIVRGVLVRASRSAAAGLGIGLAAALATSGALRSLLFGVAPQDAPTYLLVCVIVAGAVAIAAWLPARRALTTDPHAVLRESYFTTGET